MYISIHAPRVGSDISERPPRGRVGYFNPRSPCGERRRTSCMRPSTAEFQSTLPVWGATITMCIDELQLDISIHAPRVGSDFFSAMMYNYPDISIHAPRVGSDP